MRRGLFLAWLVVTGTADAREAQHPGAPITVSIDVRKGHDEDIVAGLSFGLVISHDRGATWHWMCEQALHYGFPVLPQYAYARSGGLFCASHGGLFVERDGCTFEPTEHGDTFVSAVTIGPDDTVYAAAAALDDAKIYRSSDDGVTFPASANPGQGGDWWNSVGVAPSDPQRVYLTGYRVCATPTSRGRSSARPGRSSATCAPTIRASGAWCARTSGPRPTRRAACPRCRSPT